MKTYHPDLDDHGKKKEILVPSTPTPLETWRSPNEIATVLPGGKLPAELNDIPLISLGEVPCDKDGWEQIVADTVFEEPPYEVKVGKQPASGAVVIEPDGRVWIVSPTNKHGGYVNTFPKGKIDPKMPLSLRANAIKEVLEESGLKVVLTAFLCDSERDTTTTRFYLARRISGNPADMCWESQSVHLVPRDHLTHFVSHKNDRTVLESLQRHSFNQLRREDVLLSPTLTSAYRILATINGFRRQHGTWPTRLLLDIGMSDAIQDRVFTDLGWSMLACKLEIVRINKGTVIAEGGNNSFEYEGGYATPPGNDRSDLWVWGIPLAD